MQGGTQVEVEAGAEAGQQRLAGVHLMGPWDHDGGAAAPPRLGPGGFARFGSAPFGHAPFGHASFGPAPQGPAHRQPEAGPVEGGQQQRPHGPHVGAQVGDEQQRHHPPRQPRPPVQRRQQQQRQQQPGPIHQRLLAAVLGGHLGHVVPAGLVHGQSRAGGAARHPHHALRDQYGPVGTSMDQYGPVWTSTGRYGPV